MIRPYSPFDFEDVFFLQKISYERPCTETELRVRLGHVWVAEIVGEVIGAAIVCPEENNLLWSITVAPAQRSKGWGSVLLREVARNFQELRLYVDTESPAKKLYEREGFKVEKFMFNHYGRNQHAYLMVKR